MTTGRKEDRRIRQTRRRLQDALIGLLRRKPLAKIQIKEIVEEADVSRPTFYHHFPTKEKLLFSLVDDLFEEIHQVVFDEPESEDPGDILRLMTSSFEQWLAHGEQLRWVFQVENRDLVVAALRPHIEALRARVVPDHPLPPASGAYEPYVTDFVAGGLYMVLKRWIDRGMQDSAETMGQLLYLLVDNGLTHMRVQVATDETYRSQWLADWQRIVTSMVAAANESESKR